MRRYSSKLWRNFFIRTLKISASKYRLKSNSIVVVAKLQRNKVRNIFLINRFSIVYNLGVLHEEKLLNGLNYLNQGQHLYQKRKNAANYRIVRVASFVHQLESVSKHISIAQKLTEPISFHTCSCFVFCET